MKPVDFGGGFRRPGSIAILPMDGSRLSYVRIALDEAAGTLTRIPDGRLSLEDATEAGATVTDVLHMEQPAEGRLVLRGHWDEADVEIIMIARNLDEIELTGRGFHWINERPRNR